MDEMHPRHPARHHHNEPKVIALAATKPAINISALWACGFATAAYMWCALLLQ